MPYTAQPRVGPGPGRGCANAAPACKNLDAGGSQESSLRPRLVSGVQGLAGAETGAGTVLAVERVGQKLAAGGPIPDWVATYLPFTAGGFGFARNPFPTSPLSSSRMSYDGTTIRRFTFGHRRVRNARPVADIDRALERSHDPEHGHRFQIFEYPAPRKNGR
jgi:hypothetical protein